MESAEIKTPVLFRHHYLTPNSTYRSFVRCTRVQWSQLPKPLRCKVVRTESHRKPYASPFFSAV